MSASVAPIQKLTNLPFYQERVDLGRRLPLDGPAQHA